MLPLTDNKLNIIVTVFYFIIILRQRHILKAQFLNRKVRQFLEQMEIYYDHLKEVFLERNPKFDCDYECNWGFYLWSANLVWKIHSQTTNDKHSIALVENVQRQKWRQQNHKRHFLCWWRKPVSDPIKDFWHKFYAPICFKHFDWLKFLLKNLGECMYNIR